MVNDKTKSWDNFGSDYWKAADVKSKEDQFVITDVTSIEENDKNTLILMLERNGVTKKFGCNATNNYAVQSSCPNGPEQAIGKVVTFNKVQVQNPATKTTVDGLRIVFATTEPNEVDTEEAGIDSEGNI